MTEGRGVCSTCGGSRAEHYDENDKPTTQHVYTETEGDLTTHEELRRARQKPVAATPMILPGNPTTLPRLIEVLMDKKILSRDEVIYVAGYGSKPEAPSGSADPTEGS